MMLKTAAMNHLYFDHNGASPTPLLPRGGPGSGVEC